MSHGLLPRYLSDTLIYTSDVHTRNTRPRTSNELRVPNYKYETTRNNIFHYGMKMFNELPIEIRQKASLNSFKIICKKHIMENFDV